MSNSYPQSPSLQMDTILNNNQDWLNVQDIVRNAINSLYSLISLQNQTINEIQSSLSLRPTKTELLTHLSTKVETSDFITSINDLKTSLNLHPTFDDVQTLSEDKLTKRELSQILSAKLSIDDAKAILDTKANSIEMNDKLESLQLNIDTIYQDITKQLSTFASVKDVNKLNASLSSKPNINDLTELLSSKPSREEMVNALRTKANKAEVDQTLKNKIDINEIKYVTSSDDKTSKITDFNTGIVEVDFKEHLSDVKSCDWNPYKNVIASGGKDKLVKLWDPSSKNNVIDTLHPHKNSINRVRFNKNGNWLLTASKDHLLKVIDIRMMKELQTFKGHNSEVNTMVWHPLYEDVFCSAGADRFIIFWKVGVNKCYKKLAHMKEIFDLCFNKTGTLLASGSNDAYLKFWIRGKE